jgi:hypothetical protein
VKRSYRPVEALSTMARGVTPLTLRPESPEFDERVLELPEELERLVPVQGWHAARQHGDRPPPVLHEFRGREFGHPLTIWEQAFAIERLTFLRRRGGGVEPTRRPTLGASSW